MGGMYLHHRFILKRWFLKFLFFQEFPVVLDPKLSLFSLCIYDLKYFGRSLKVPLSLIAYFHWLLGFFLLSCFSVSWGPMIDRGPVKIRPNFQFNFFLSYFPSKYWWNLTRNFTEIQWFSLQNVQFLVSKNASRRAASLNTKLLTCTW